MKTLLKIASFALALFLTTGLTAQEISIGIKTGVQNANVKVPGFIDDISLLPDFKSITTTNVGIVSEIRFNQTFALQPELNYTTKGFKVQEDFDLNLFDLPLPVGVTAASKFRYLELPLLAKAKFGNEKTNFYLLAGPTVGYALNGLLETRARLLVEIDVFDTAINLNDVGYERWELGGMAGAGVSFQTKTGGQFFLDARYSHGFTQPYDIPLVHEKVQHYNFGVNIGFMLPLGGGNRVPRA